MLEKGSTLEEVGGKYNITRERVRQLYQACTKHPYTELVRKRIQIKKIRKDEELKKQKKIVVFYCRDCSKPVRYLEEKHSHQQIICRSCWKQWRAEGRAWDKVNICEKCGKKFHPHVNMRSQKFCSQECYTAHGRGRHLIMPVVSSIFRINGRIINHA